MKTGKQKRHKQDDQDKIRSIVNEEMRHKIGSIVSAFRGNKNTTSIKTRRKKILITHVQDKAGNDQYDRLDIADVLA